MKTYRACFLLLGGIILIVGLSLAVLTIPPLTLAVLVGLGAGAGAALQPALLRWPVLHRHSVIAGSLGTLLMISLVGSLGVSGAAIFGLLLLAALPLLRAQEGPRQVQRAAVHPSVNRAPVAPKPLTPKPLTSEDRGEESPAPVVAGWTDEELCWAWRCSFSRVQRAGNAAEVARVAQERRSYLDEIERRDPHGFTTWMRDGARAGSDPRRYLRPER
jgi:hypothetical protein